MKFQASFVTLLAVVSAAISVADAKAADMSKRPARLNRRDEHASLQKRGFGFASRLFRRGSGAFDGGAYDSGANGGGGYGRGAYDGKSHEDADRPENEGSVSWPGAGAENDGTKKEDYFNSGDDKGATQVPDGQGQTLPQLSGGYGSGENPDKGAQNPWDKGAQNPWDKGSDSQQYPWAGSYQQQPNPSGDDSQPQGYQPDDKGSQQDDQQQKELERQQKDQERQEKEQRKQQKKEAKRLRKEQERQQKEQERQQREQERQQREQERQQQGNDGSQNGDYGSQNPNPDQYGNNGQPIKPEMYAQSPIPVPAYGERGQGSPSDNCPKFPKLGGGDADTTPCFSEKASRNEICSALKQFGVDTNQVGCKEDECKEEIKDYSKHACHPDKQCDFGWHNTCDFYLHMGFSDVSKFGCGAPGSPDTPGESGDYGQQQPGDNGDKGDNNDYGSYGKHDNEDDEDDCEDDKENEDDANPYGSGYGDGGADQKPWLSDSQNGDGLKVMPYGSGHADTDGPKPYDADKNPDADRFNGGSQQYPPGADQLKEDYNPEDKGADYSPEDKGADYNPEDKGTGYSPEDKGADYNPEGKGADYNPEDKGADYNPEGKGADYNPEDKGTGYNGGASAWGSPEDKGAGYNGGSAKEAEDCDKDKAGGEYGVDGGSGIGVGSGGYGGSGYGGSDNALLEQAQKDPASQEQLEAKPDPNTQPDPNAQADPNAQPDSEAGKKDLEAEKQDPEAGKQSEKDSGSQKETGSEQ